MDDMLSGVWPGALLILLLLPTTPGVRAAETSTPAEPPLQLGNRFLHTGRYPDAVKTYEEALRTANPHDARLARVGIVTASLRVGDFTRARVESEALLAVTPADPDALSLLGDALWSSGLFDEAEARYLQALDAGPSRPGGHHGMARALAGRNKLDEALAEAQTAVRLAPDAPEPHQTIGVIYARMHRYGDAAAALRVYVGLLPSKDRTVMADWARSEIEFMESFGRRVPFAMEPGTDDQVYVVDFRLEGRKIVVLARVNHGWFQDFVIDTGAEQTLLSRWTARQVGVTPIAYTPTAGVGEQSIHELQLGRIDSLELGSLTLRNVRCIIGDSRPKTMGSGPEQRLSPIAMGFSMIIDYGSHTLTMGKHLPVEQGDLELPLRMNRLAVVRGTVDGMHPAAFVVDTGGEAISLSQSLATSLGRPDPMPKIRLNVFGASGRDPAAFLMPFVRLAFDTIRYPNYSVAILNLRMPSVLLGFQIGGIVGHDFLSRYRVGIDLERSVLRLKKRPLTSRRE